MADTRNTAEKALARSRTWTTYTPKGMCARHVSDCVSDGHFGYTDVGSAADAWRLAKQKVTDGSTPPPGAPVYWQVAGSRWGHIAIATGNWHVRSTDVPANEGLHELSHREMGQRWPGMTYLGWSRDFAGDPIPGLEDKASAEVPAKVKPSIRVSHLKAHATNDPRNNDVIQYNKAVWAALTKANPAYTKAKKAQWAKESAQVYGWGTASATYELYKALGWATPSHSVKSWATPGPSLLKHLGFTVLPG
ncbi:MAG: hypothetical protein L0H96_21525 [Humibacillus sp.]|nr:hypothetical protein [Humibacillus sp.]MDN5779478.1 hypothetical protein [Humibacillus sp.]